MWDLTFALKTSVKSKSNWFIKNKGKCWKLWEKKIKILILIFFTYYLLNNILYILIIIIIYWSYCKHMLAKGLKGTVVNRTLPDYKWRVTSNYAFSPVYYIFAIEIEPSFLNFILYAEKTKKTFTRKWKTRKAIHVKNLSFICLL